MGTLVIQDLASSDRLARALRLARQQTDHWPARLAIYQTGTRRSRSTGRTIYVIELVAAPSTLTEISMDAIEQFLTDLVVKAIVAKVPTLGADTQVKVQKGVADCVAAALDLATIFLAVCADAKSVKA